MVGDTVGDGVDGSGGVDTLAGDGVVGKLDCDDELVHDDELVTEPKDSNRLYSKRLSSMLRDPVA